MKLSELQGLTLKKVFKNHNVRTITLAKLANLTAANVCGFLGGYSTVNNVAAQKILKLARTLDPATYTKSLRAQEAGDADNSDKSQD